MNAQQAALISSAIAEVIADGAIAQRNAVTEHKPDGVVELGCHFNDALGCVSWTGPVDQHIVHYDENGISQRMYDSIQALYPDVVPKHYVWDWGWEPAALESVPFTKE